MISQYCTLRARRARHGQALGRRERDVLQPRVVLVRERLRAVAGQPTRKRSAGEASVLLPKTTKSRPASSPAMAPPRVDDARRAAGERHRVDVDDAAVLRGEDDRSAVGREREVLDREIGRLEDRPVLAAGDVVDVEVPAVRFEVGPPLPAQHDLLSVRRPHRLHVRRLVRRQAPSRRAAGDRHEPHVLVGRPRLRRRCRRGSRQTRSACRRARTRARRLRRRTAASRSRRA